MKRAALHLCEVHGDHYNEPAVGYFICLTVFKTTAYLFACEECREWWMGRHPDATWMPREMEPPPMVMAPRARVGQPISRQAGPRRR